MTTFSSMGLSEPILRALSLAGYEKPTPVQEQAIPIVMQRRDLVAIAQTGTGKTAAFSLPLLHHLSEGGESGRRIRALILTPTRELAGQIEANLQQYGQFLKLRHAVIFGGVGKGAQISALRKGVDILVATPGRLLDLCGEGYIRLDGVEYFILDEADRMLDMGFIHDVKRVLKMLPARKQNLMFSATMPASISSLANSFLERPLRVDVTPPSTTVERIDQQVMFVRKEDKKLLLADLLQDADVEKAIVFTRTKHGADRVVKDLVRMGIEAAAIHGNKSQNARVRALEGFRSGDVGVLVATDVASRGLDIEKVSHVINFDLPNEPESYVHRIGRTGRAGRDGIAISFCDIDERMYLRDIERSTGAEIERVLDQQWHLAEAVPESAMIGVVPAGRPSGGNRGGGGRDNGNRHGGGRQNNGGQQAAPSRNAPRQPSNNNGSRSPSPAVAGDQPPRRRRRRSRGGQRTGDSGGNPRS